MREENERAVVAARGDGSSPLEHLASVIHLLPVATIVAEAPGGRIILHNARAAAIWRRPLPLSATAAASIDWDAYHRDGRPYLPEEWPLTRTAATGEIIEDEELEIRRGDGTRGMIRIATAPIRDARGGMLAAVATIQDITEQHSDERTRRFLTEVSGVLASSLSYDTTLRNVVRLAVPELASWCAVDILGDDGHVERLAVEYSDNVPRNEAIQLAQHSPDGIAASDGVARVLRTGTVEVACTAHPDGLGPIATDDAHLRLLQAFGATATMIVPLVARGRTVGALSFISRERDRAYDGTDLELARELAARAALAIDNARLYHETQVASRSKSDFLAVMSHELRTPLTAIIGYAELLELGIPEPVTESQREQIERIELAARHLQQLIEEILAVASLEAGEMKIRRQSIAVGNLLHKARVIIRPMAMAKQLDLEVEGVADPIVVETDPEKLLQVLLNLLSNAVKFTEEGRIGLSARVVAEQLELRVSDTGIGVDPRDHDRIFEPFWQVDQPSTRRAGGTGLGLTISRRLLDLLDGEITLDSEPGRGSTFIVRVPLHPIA